MFHEVCWYRVEPAGFGVQDYYKAMMTYKIVLNMICDWVILDCNQDLRLLVQGFQDRQGDQYRKFRQLQHFRRRKIEGDTRYPSQNFDYFYSY